MWKIEGELAALLHPEKERLQANTTQAINCMLDLLYPPSDSYLPPSLSAPSSPG